MNEVHTHADEISLRDLYLILKRGLPIILGVSLLTGVAAFILVGLQDPVYEAESTTLITPPPIRIQGSGGLTLSPGVDVPFETYETLATSRPVLEATVSRVPEAGMTADALMGSGNLSKLMGPQRPDQVAPLSVTHTVAHTDPELAATLADAWAETTLETVRNSLLANLTPVDTTTSSEVQALRERLREAENAWEAFQRTNNRTVLELRSTRLSEAISEAEGHLVVIPEISTLPTIASVVGPAGAPAASAALTAPRLNLDQEIAANNAILTHLRQNGGDSNEIRMREALAESLQARRALLDTQLQTYRAEYERVRTSLATLERQESELNRELTLAQNAYQDVVNLQPTISYVSQLAPANARILNSAAVPSEPAGPRRMLTTVLAVIVAGMLATLFVFLREAVSAPAPVVTGPRAEPASGGVQARG